MADIFYKLYSIIIPSFNRLEEIIELLESIQEMEFLKNRFEVIIVDDGSTDGTLEFLKKYQRKANFNFNYVFQKNLGPGAARNAGMSVAQGDFCIFVDSDCLIPKHWLIEIDSNLKSQQAAAFGGPDSFHPNFSPLLKAINYSMTSFLSTGGLRGRQGKKLAKFYPRSFNMGISKLLWQKIGGFGSLRHGQDIEFSYRILKSGVKIIYIEKAFVYHKRRTNLRRFYRQVYNWGVARINLYKIDAAMLEPLHTLPAIATMIILLTCFIAIFFEFARYILLCSSVFLLGVLLYAMLDSVRIYRDIKPALFLPLIMPAQIIGYGLGFITNFIRRVVFRKEKKVGFKKSYYK
jgi:glycosyltransferase involved in cell wall biosynthesis